MLRVCRAHNRDSPELEKTSIVNQYSGHIARGSLHIIPVSLCLGMIVRVHLLASQIMIYNNSDIRVMPITLSYTHSSNIGYHRPATCVDRTVQSIREFLTDRRPGSEWPCVANSIPESFLVLSLRKGTDNRVILYSSYRV